MNRIVIDVISGEKTIVPLTQEEIDAVQSQPATARPKSLIETLIESPDFALLKAELQK
jgi:hypothetical protein